MILLLFFAFLSGLVTILAPCIWPLLPIVLSSTVGGKGHQRALGITLGIMASFTIFTLAISTLVMLLHIDPNIMRSVAVVVITFLGLTMVIPKLTLLLETAVSRLTGYIRLQGGPTGNGFGAGFATGLALGIVWSPCAGPILAAIVTLSATGKVTFDVVMITLAYVTGVGIPLFLFAYGGQQLLAKSKVVNAHTPTIQKVFGIIMILTAYAIYTNYDTYLQAKLLNAFPQFSQALTSFEKSGAVTDQLDVLRGTKKTNMKSLMPNSLFNENYKAPEFRGITKWLNTDSPLTLSELKGKVVLVDFWTYTCINCIRTLPHVTRWYNTYKDQGFVVVGIHTPEFAFEKETQNVENAINRYGIKYPVAQDNEYDTWNAYNNQYWPAEYLIDANGIVRRTHFGEGEYEDMESAIRMLLEEAGQKPVSAQMMPMPDYAPRNVNSPEAYIGAERMAYYYPTNSVGTGKKNFTADPNPSVNTFSFGGEWDVMGEYSVTGIGAVLYHHFRANKVFLVMRPGVSIDTNTSDARQTVKVFLDGKLVDAASGGEDVQNGTVVVDTDRLYTLIDLHGKNGDHILRLEFPDPGIEVFAFTFG